MQVFLSAPNYNKAAKSLDKRRLFKQLIEAIQVLQTNIKGFGPWYNHSVCRMWRGYNESLADYIEAIIEECKFRGIKANYQKYYRIIDEYSFQNDVKYPKILKNPEFYLKMRRNLYWKGKSDATCETLRKYWKVRSLNPWLEKSGYPKKNLLYLHPDKIEELEKYAQTLGLELLPNYYEKFKSDLK